MAATTFADLGVSVEVVTALEKRGIVEAFPIQTASIEATLAGRDICGKAPTGSGKTLAFGVPAIDLAGTGKPWRPRALILTPTRELATQIKDELEPLAKARGRSILTVFGGTNIERDIRRLERGVDILVACPGRLEDLISRRCCELRDANIVVVDEADRMADMGFLPSVKRLLDQTPDDRHTMLFSATLDGDVDALIKRYQHEPLTFEIDDQAGDVGDVEHSWFVVQPVDRIGSAVAVLERYASSIVFCRTRRGCDRVANMFAKRGLPAVAIHGDRSQSQRERALRDFITGKAQVLVATDVAARGIHVDNVALVMHYDPAGSDKDYIHRSGRTGRAGQDGRVISMVVEDKRKIARQLQKDLGMKPGFDTLDIDELPSIVERPHVVEHKPTPQSRSNKSQGGRSSQGAPATKGRRSDGNDRDRNDRDRSPRDRNDRDRSPRDRNDRDRSPRDRNDRDRSPRDRNDRDRSPRDRNDRDRSPRDRNDRDRDRGPRRNRPRRASNDWYPPGYHDDEDRRGQGPKKGSGRNGSGRGGSGRGGSGRGGSGRGGSGRNGSGSERSGSERGAGSRRPSSSRGPAKSRDPKAEGDERPTGGSGTKPHKSRASKGRHADRATTKNKGKRRNTRRR